MSQFKKIQFTFFALVPSLTMNTLVQARDLKMELPIANAVSNAAWRGVVGPSIQFKFGDDIISGSIEKLVELKKMDHYARPYVFVAGRRLNRDDASTCNEALRNVLTDAADLAKTSGANMVLMHSSSYDAERPTDTKRYFLCNSGTNSSTVDVTISVLRVAAIPSAPVAAVLAPVRVTPRLSPPIASGFADVYDITKIPYITENCKKIYANWLTQANPKAFSISPSANCGYTWGTNPPDKNLPPDPSERSQVVCNKITKGANDCKHYAIDGVVVWKP